MDLLKVILKIKVYLIREVVKSKDLQKDARELKELLVNTLVELLLYQII